VTDTVNVYPVPGSTPTPTYPPASSAMTQLGPSSYALVSNSGERGPAGPSLPIVFFRPGEAMVVAGRARYRFPFNATLIGCSAALARGPEGDDLTFEVILGGGGVPLYSMTVLEGAEEVAEDTSRRQVLVGDFITVSVTGVGSTFGGEDLSIFIRYEA